MRNETGRLYSAIAEKYARDVIAGRVLACKWVKLACERHMRDLRIPQEIPDPGQQFSQMRAQWEANRRWGRSRSDARWEALKRSAQWDHLDSASARTLRLLNFIAHDFADPAKAALKKLADKGTIAAYVDESRSIAATNGGYIIVKCAFQMLAKSMEVANKLNGIARQLHSELPDYRRQMAVEMGK